MTSLSRSRFILVLSLAVLVAPGCIDTSLNLKMNEKDVRPGPDVVDAGGDSVAADLEIDVAPDQQGLPDLPDAEVTLPDVPDAEVTLPDVPDAEVTLPDVPDVADTVIPPGDVEEVEVQFTDWVEVAEADAAVDCPALCEGIECGYAGDGNECECNNCDDFDPCTENLCDAQGGQCAHPLADGFCLIAGECSAAGVPSVDNPCLACLPLVSVGEFSPDDSQECGPLPFATAAGCADGECVVLECAAGRGNCDSGHASGCETDTTQDMQHCGECGKVCLSQEPGKVGICTADGCADEDCPGGTWNLDGLPGNGCEYLCVPSGAEACNGLDDDCNGEIDETFNLAGDPDNCNECGHVCLHETVTAWLCAGGICFVKQCVEGRKDADGDGSNGCEVEWQPEQELWVDGWNTGDPDEDGSEDHPFDTIQEAVDASFPGYLVHVADGVYVGGIVVDVPELTIEGSGLDKVFVSTPEFGTGFLVTADEVTAKSLTVTGGRYGIHFQGMEEQKLQGGDAIDLSIGQLKAPDGNGEDSVGILLEMAEEITVSGVDIHAVTGGIGSSCGSKGCHAGTGGVAAGIRAVGSVGADLLANAISGVIGGDGGKAGEYTTSGSGGIAAGIYLSDTVGCTLAANTLLSVTGGKGDDYFPSVEQEGFGVYLEPDALENEIQLTNTMEGDPIAYLYGANGVTLEELTLTAEANPTNHGKIAVFESINVTVADNIVSNQEGESGRTAYVDGLTGWGIHIEGCTGCVVSGNTVSSISGGKGGRGNYTSSGRAGGAGIGIHIAASQFCDLLGNSVHDITGGQAGAIGFSGKGGRGGDANGILLSDCMACIAATNTVSDVTGAGGEAGSLMGTFPGSGGDGGTAYGVSLAMTESNTLSGNIISAVASGAGGNGYLSGGAGGQAAGMSIRGSGGAKLQGTTVYGIAAGKGGTGNPDGEAGGAHGVATGADQQSPVTVSDSIIAHASGFCLFNDDNNGLSILFTTHSNLHGCGLGESYNSAVQGTCISEDPLFVDPDNGDFHLQPGSPCIDAGKPTTECSSEPSPNGCRVNMGAYGNTAEATSKVGAEHCDVCP